MGVVIGIIFIKHKMFDYQINIIYITFSGIWYFITACWWCSVGIIEARKKALQKKKEYYDYDKNLKNRQKEIDSIKAQIAALESLTGTMDAATKAKLAQLKADLAEKEDSLQETKDEHTYTFLISSSILFSSVADSPNVL